MIKQLSVSCAAFLIITAGAVNAAPRPGERLLERQPAAVQKTIQAQLGDGRLRSVDKDEADGDVTYDVEIVRQGKTRSFTVGANGELLDAEVFLEELSAPVQATIKKKVGSETLGEINKSMAEGEVSYDVELIGGGKTRTFTLDASGKLTDEEVFLAELPEDIRKAIGKETAGGAIDEITRSFEVGEVFYDVDVAVNGKTQTLTFDAKGVLLSRQEDVALSAVPDAAQKQIQALSTGGQLVTVAKVTENDQVSFDVDIRQEGKVKSYSVGSDGKVIQSDAN